MNNAVLRDYEKSSFSFPSISRIFFFRALKQISIHFTFNSKHVSGRLAVEDAYGECLRGI